MEGGLTLVTIHLTNEQGSKRFVKLKYDGLHYVGAGEEQTIAQKLGIRNKAVFECLALHQNQNCLSDLTIKQISELLGMTEGTVKTAIKELESFTYEGKPILIKTQVGAGRNKQNNYTILENPLVSQFGESLEEPLESKIDPKQEVMGSKFDLTKEQRVTKELNNIKELEESNMTEKKLTKKVEQKAMTRKDVVVYFKGLLEEKGIKDQFSFPRVYATMKKQGVYEILDSMKNNEIKRTLEVIAENYPSWNTNSQYTLSVYVISWKWVWERALNETKKEKQEVSQMKEQVVVNDKRQQTELKQINSLLERMKKQGGNK
jgi:hypothetical protein